MKPLGWYWDAFDNRWRVLWSEEDWHKRQERKREKRERRRERKRQKRERWRNEL